jgi:acyl-CoA synthetase (AMP-forming)/AMP-acid ligase II
MAPGWGRSVDYIVRRDGASVSPYALTCALETIPALSQYKVVQETVESIVVHVVPGAGFDESTEREIRDKLRGLLGGLDAAVKRVPSIPSSPSGKFRIVESLAGAASRARSRRTRAIAARARPRAAS